jgi:uncharacterized protein (TIGR02611 family)
MSEQDQGGVGTAESSSRRGPREVIRANRHAYLVYRIVVGVLGTAIIVLGLILVPLPGPGWLIVFAGLALLATEFTWAERLLHRGRVILERWTDWVKAQSLPVRLGLGAASLALVAASLWGYVAWRGVPGWIPFV